MTDDSAKILFQCFPQEAIVNTSGMGRDVHSLMLSIQHFLCQPWHHPPSKVGFGEAVVVCDKPEPCKFLSLMMGQVSPKSSHTREEVSHQDGRSSGVPLYSVLPTKAAQQSAHTSEYNRSFCLEQWVQFDRCCGKS